MEDRKVGVQHGEQDNEEQRDEELVAIAVNIKMGFAVCLPPNCLTATGEDVPAMWSCWLLASIPDSSSVSFRPFHRKILKFEKTASSSLML